MNERKESVLFLEGNPVVTVFAVADGVRTMAEMREIVEVAALFRDAANTEARERREGEG
jgi:hypothetical protein